MLYNCYRVKIKIIKNAKSEPTTDLCCLYPIQGLLQNGAQRGAWQQLSDILTSTQTITTPAL